MRDGSVPRPSLKSSLSFIRLRAVAMAAKYDSVTDQMEELLIVSSPLWSCWETPSVATAAVEAWFCSEEVHVGTRRSHFHHKFGAGSPGAWVYVLHHRALEAGSWTSPSLLLFG